MNPQRSLSGALLSLEQASATFPSDSPVRVFAAFARTVATYPSVVSIDLSAEVEDSVTRVELWIYARACEQDLREALETFGHHVAEVTGFAFGGLVPTHWPVFGNVPSHGFVLIWAGPAAAHA